MKRLSSRDNPLVKRLLRFKQRPERFIPKPQRPEAEVLVEGPRPLEMALKAGIRCSLVAVTEEFASSERYFPLIDRLLHLKTPIVVLEQRLLRQLSETVTPQGIIGIASYRMHHLEEFSNEGVIVVGDEVQDPANVGGLLRCVDAVGLAGVILLKGSANPFHPKVIRSSAGSLFNLKVSLVEKDEFLQFVSRKNFNLIYTSQDAEVDVFSWQPALPIAVVFGNEARGVSEDIMKASRGGVRVPIYGRAESLNLTTAAAVVLYHIIRTKGQVSSP